MNKEFVLYEESLELKNLGFDEPCFGLYYNDKTFYPTQCKSHEQYYGQICSAPLYSQAFKFFRKKYNIEGYVVCVQFNSQRIKGYQYVIISNNYNSYEQLGDFNTWEEAELACIRKLIEIKTKS